MIDKASLLSLKGGDLLEGFIIGKERLCSIMSNDNDREVRPGIYLSKQKEYCL